jgi:hypothetical protein
MDIEQIMIDFFESDTTLESEKKMFSVLSYDESMIAEFKNYWILDKTAQKVVNTYTPPIYVTNAIFKKFGNSFPQEATKRTAFSLLKQKNVLSHVLNTIAAVALTIAIMLFFFYPNTNNNNKAETHKTAQKIQGSESQVPLIESKENSIQPGKSSKLVNRSSVSGKSRINENVSQLQMPQNKDQYLTFSSVPSGSNFSMIENISSIQKLPNNENAIHLPIQFKNEKPLGITVGVNGSATWDIPKALIPSNYYTPLNNTCISLYYDVTGNLKIGIEARQETFYNQYTGTDVDGKKYLYLQQSNFTSIGSKLIYYPFDKDLLNPYAGVVLGFNPAGFIARPNTGIEYQPYPDITFSLGVEYSYFWFNHQKNLFHTSKIGINYGIIKTF